MLQAELSALRAELRESPRCSGVLCPSLSGYAVGCNANGRCEYAPRYSDDWQTWRRLEAWIYVPPGSFAMGTSRVEGSTGEVRPVHTVTFAEGFFIGKFPVTVLQYEACEETPDSGCSPPSVSHWDGLGWGVNRSSNERGTHPQNGLTWEQADAVCAWLGGRIPSEAEWEYAARGPLNRFFPWGDAPSADCQRAVCGSSPGHTRPWGCEDCDEDGCSGTQEVGSRPLGMAWSGALDMAGNVWEWTQDWWHWNYVGAPVDGSAWLEDADEQARVVRGTSFDGAQIHVTSASRLFQVPSHHGASYGARCVRDLTP